MIPCGYMVGGTYLPHAAPPKILSEAGPWISKCRITTVIFHERLQKYFVRSVDILEIRGRYRFITAHPPSLKKETAKT